MFSLRALQLCLRGGKKLPSACRICKRNTKYLCINCEKSVFVRFEYSIAEENEDTLGWEANKNVGYCLPCAGAAAGAGQIEIFSENRHPPMALNQLLWKIIFWTFGVPITSNQPLSWLVELVQERINDKSINTLRRARNLSSKQPVTTFHVATLSSAVFL